MRLAILGGTTFIGPAIVERARDDGHEVVIVHRGRSTPPVEADRVALCDRRNQAGLRTALAEIDPDAIIDTCAYTGDDAEILARATPVGTHLVVLSSMDVYRAFATVRSGGPATDPLPLDESSALREQRYPYAGIEPPHDVDFDLERYDKLDVEAALPQAIVLRLPMVYGERDPKRREDLVLRRIRAGRARLPVGAGTFLWTRGYVRDIADAAVRAASARELAGMTLNIAEERTVSIEQWMRQIIAAAGSSIELVRVADERLPEDLALTRSISQHLLASSARARTLLDLEETPAERAVVQSVAWHLANPPDQPDDDFTADDEALADTR